MSFLKILKNLTIYFKLYQMESMTKIQSEIRATVLNINLVSNRKRNIIEWDNLIKFKIY